MFKRSNATRWVQALAALALVAAFALLAIAPSKADSAEYSWRTDIQKPATAQCYEAGERVVLSTLTYPGTVGARWLIEGEVKLKAVKRQALPTQYGLTFVRWDGDKTGASDYAWTPGAQSATNLHMTSGKGGRDISLQVWANGAYCVDMVQFKLVKLEGK